MGRLASAITCGYGLCSVRHDEHERRWMAPEILIAYRRKSDDHIVLYWSDVTYPDGTGYGYSADGGSWTGADLGGVTYDAPTVVSFLGKLYVFHRGTDDKIYQRAQSQNFSWEQWFVPFPGHRTNWHQSLHRALRAMAARSCTSSIATATRTSGTPGSRGPHGAKTTSVRPPRTPSAPPAGTERSLLGSRKSVRRDPSGRDPARLEVIRQRWKDHSRFDCQAGQQQLGIALAMSVATEEREAVCGVA